MTQRTTQGRYLLKPSPRLNALVAGCFARAQKNTGATVHAVAVLSNHLHCLASFETVEQMAQFACHLKTNLSKEVGRLHDWQGSFFAGRYKAVPLSDEPEIQRQRLQYILSQGAKEGLVLSPKDWPGVHSANALARGENIEGLWVDRTGLHAARQKDRHVPEAQFTERETLELTPLPFMADLTPDKRSVLVRELIDEIEVNARVEHRLAGTSPLGTAAVCRRDPHHRPRELSTSPQPKFHATGSVYAGLMAAYSDFLVAYRSAAEKLAAGLRTAAFPENCFPPGLPFVGPGDWVPA